MSRRYLALLIFLLELCVTSLSFGASSGIRPLRLVTKDWPLYSVLPRYRGESNLDVHYFEEAEREIGQVFLDANNRLVDRRGELLGAGEMLRSNFVVSNHGFVYTDTPELLAAKQDLASFSGQGVIRYQHSSYLGGDVVPGAGEWQVLDGVLQSLNNWSGHYRPTFFSLKLLVEGLREQGVSTAQMMMLIKFGDIVIEQAPVLTMDMSVDTFLASVDENTISPESLLENALLHAKSASESAMISIMRGAFLGTVTAAEAQRVAQLILEQNTLVAESLANIIRLRVSNWLRYQMTTTAFMAQLTGTALGNAYFCNAMLTDN